MKTTNNKTLYFEGAGCTSRGDVSNCRIRTAFHLDDGRSVYLEISGMETTRCTAPIYQKFTNYGIIDHCFCINGVFDDGHSNHKNVRSGFAFEYCQKEILRFVNSLGASFDAIKVLPDLAGYRVHGDGRRQYNFADEFIFDEYKLEQRQRVYDSIKEREASRGEKSPCFSLWVDHEDPAILHYHNCRNGERFDICIECPADPEKAPVLNKSNAIVGGYYAGCGYLLKVYRISEEYAEKYDLMYLDRCEVSSYGDMALPGSDIYRRKAPRN